MNLGRHVGPRPHSVRAALSWRQLLSEPKVGDPQVEEPAAAVEQKHVLGLDVAVYDRYLMQRIQTAEGHAQNLNNIVLTVSGVLLLGKPTSHLRKESPPGSSSMTRYAARGLSK